jgi:hypothetical protein
MENFSDHPLNKRYNLDNAIPSLWEFYKSWFTSLFVISFVFALITSGLTSTFNFSEIQNSTDPYLLIAEMKSMIGPYAILVVVSALLNLILQYYILRKPLNSDENILNHTGEVMLKFFVPLIVVYIIIFAFAIIAITFGFLLIVVGSIFAIIYVFIFYCMAAPVMMIEKTGITETLKRIFTLTHKRFWPNMGWACIFLILLIVISLILSAIIMIPFSGGFIKSILNPEAAGELMNLAKKPSFIILSSLSSALTMPLFPIFALILYFNGRSYEENEPSNMSDGDNYGDTVRVEDLYAQNTDQETNSDDTDPEQASPTVDDLMP